MGEFMQHLPGLCLCWVITSRAKLRPRLRLSGQGPTPDPEIWGCTEPNALHCRQEMRAGTDPAAPSLEHRPHAAGKRLCKTVRCILDVVSPNNTSKKHPCQLARKAPQAFFFFCLLKCKEQPLTPCLHLSAATWVQHGCSTCTEQGLHQASQPQEEDAPTSATRNISLAGCQHVAEPTGQCERAPLRPVARPTGAPAAGFNEKLIAGVCKVPTAPHRHMLKTRLGFRGKYLVMFFKCKEDEAWWGTAPSRSWSRAAHSFTFVN